MTKKALMPSRALQQIGKLSLPVPTPEVKCPEHGSIDCLGALEEAARFFLRQALEAADEKMAKKAAREAKRLIKTLARYRLLEHTYRRIRIRSEQWIE